MTILRVSFQVLFSLFALLVGWAMFLYSTAPVLR